jgi:hypothetical protein
LQGRCSTPPSAEQLGTSVLDPPLIALKPQQCLLIVNRMMMSATGGNVWLDNIYVRVVASPNTPDESTLGVTQSSLLWMTNVTVQETGRYTGCEGCGFLATSEAKIFADGTRRLRTPLFRWVSCFAMASNPPCKAFFLCSPVLHVRSICSIAWRSAVHRAFALPV